MRPKQEQHTEELPDLCSSPNIISVMKSWKMRLMGLVVRMGENSNAYGILVEKPEGRDHMEHLGVNRQLVLKCMFQK